MCRPRHTSKQGSEGDAFSAGFDDVCVSSRRTFSALRVCVCVCACVHACVCVCVHLDVCAAMQQPEKAAQRTPLFPSPSSLSTLRTFCSGDPAALKEKETAMATPDSAGDKERELERESKKATAAAWYHAKTLATLRIAQQQRRSPGPCSSLPVSPASRRPARTRHSKRARVLRRC